MYGVAIEHEPYISEAAASTSCLNKWMETASMTTSFIRKATGRYIAGKPPASRAQALGRKGIIVTVPKKVTTEPRAPRMPSFGFQNPRRMSVPKIISVVPRKKLAPRAPNAGINQNTIGLCAIKGVI